MKKKILIGCIFAVFLMLFITMISSGKVSNKKNIETKENGKVFL